MRQLKIKNIVLSRPRGTEFIRQTVLEPMTSDSEDFWDTDDLAKMTEWCAECLGEMNDEDEKGLYGTD